MSKGFDEDVWCAECDDDFLIVDELTVWMAWGVEIVVKPWLLPLETAAL